MCCLTVPCPRPAPWQGNRNCDATAGLAKSRTKSLAKTKTTDSGRQKRSEKEPKAASAETSWSGITGRRQVVRLDYWERFGEPDDNSEISSRCSAQYFPGRALVLVFCILALSVATAEARPYRLAWDRKSDGLTTGYRVYYGTAPGSYQLANGVDVGNAQEFTADLTPGVTYYFAVRAYSSATLGPPSAELSFTVPLGASISVNTASVAPGATVTRDRDRRNGQPEGIGWVFSLGSCVKWLDRLEVFERQPHDAGDRE